MKKYFLIALLSACETSTTADQKNTNIAPVSTPTSAPIVASTQTKSAPAAIVEPPPEPRYFYLEPTPQKKVFTVNHPDPVMKEKINKLIAKSRKGSETCKPSMLSTAILSFECTWTEYPENRDAMSEDHSRGLTFDLRSGEPGRVALADLFKENDPATAELLKSKDRQPKNTNFTFEIWEGPRPKNNNFTVEKWEDVRLSLYDNGDLGYAIPFPELQALLRNDSLLSTLQETAQPKTPAPSKN